MKRTIQKWLIAIFFRKPIRRYIDTSIADDDTLQYLHEVLYNDEGRMIGSRESLMGYYDFDIAINRELQQTLKKKQDERDQDRVL